MIKAASFAMLATLAYSASIPFIISTEDAAAEFAGAPRIQSFTFAQWKGRWVFIGGRTAGYHAVGGGEAEFLRADANRFVWVVDPSVRPARTWKAPLDSLPERLMPVQDQWGSTAQLSYQDGETLYIAGGYGQNHEGKWLTHSLLSAVSLPQLIEGITREGRIPPSSVRFVRSPLVQSTGGELVKLPDGYFYLVMGHNFTGSYTAFQGQGEKNRPAVSQEYLNEIRKLKITTSADGTPELSLVEAFRDEGQFHRRDLNVTRFFSPRGPGLAVYGGVFTPDTQLGWTKPVYLASGGKPVVDGAFDQRMNAYGCATMLLYDSRAETMYTTLFGGISQHFWEGNAHRFTAHPRVGTRSDATYLDGLQWSDQISTIQRRFTPDAEETSEFVQPNALPAYIGSDAVFIPTPELARVEKGTDILDLKQLTGKRTLIGYLYGGVRASPYQFPYTRTSKAYNSGTVPTKASDLVLKVFIEVPPN